jgi:hypothetical protein
MKEIKKEIKKGLQRIILLFPHCTITLARMDRGSHKNLWLSITQLRTEILPCEEM